MSNDLFDNNSGPVIDPDKDYSVDLVGEGKKFKDIPALARGKVEADNFINSLQTELAGLRAELNKRSGLDEVLNALKNQPQPQPVVTPVEQPVARTMEVKPEDIEALVERQLTARESQRLKEDNVRNTMAKLQETFGHDYVNVLKGKMDELGVDKDWVNGLAATNPKALLKLVGAENKPTGNDLFAPPPSSHNAGFKPNVQERNQAYYDKLMKENPSVYWHKDTQVAMHKDANRLGSRFFSTP